MLMLQGILSPSSMFLVRYFLIFYYYYQILRHGFCPPPPRVFFLWAQYALLWADVELHQHFAQTSVTSIFNIGSTFCGHSRNTL